MDVEEAEVLYPESKSWRTWLNELRLMAYNTRRHYLRDFLQFLDKWGVSPEELYELRMKHLTSPDPRDRRVIEGWVKTSMKEIQDQGKSASTARMISKAVTSFFKSQNLEFTLRSREKPMPRYNGQRVIMKRQILTLYDRVGEEHRLRNRAILMTLKDSGLRVSDLCSLNIEDYTGARTLMNEAGELFRVLEPLEVVKTGVLAHVHLGPEAVKAVDLYLEDLKKNNIEPRPDEQGTPLFINRHGERHTASAMSSLIWKLAEKLDKSHKISGHSLRKYHRTQLESVGMPESWVKRLQGKVASVYSRPEETGQLTEKYVECYDSLRIFIKSADAFKVEEQADRIRELEAQVREFERQFESERRFKREAQDIVASLERRYGEQQKQIDDLKKMFEKLTQTS